MSHTKDCILKYITYGRFFANMPEVRLLEYVSMAFVFKHSNILISSPMPPSKHRLEHCGQTQVF